MRQPLALDEAQIEYLIEFRSYKNKSVMAAARSLINFFREVCPQLLPKKYLGRDKEWLKEDKEDPLIFGQQKLEHGISGQELLKEGADIAAERLLTDKDLRKIKVLKMRQAMRKVDKHGFREDDDEKAEKVEGEESDSDDSGDEESYDGDAEFGEDELMEEYGESELSEAEESEEAPKLVPIVKEKAKEEEVKKEVNESEEDESDSSSYVSSIDPLQKNAERDSVHTSEMNSS